MEEILHQLSLVVYPIIFAGLYTSQVISRISSINSMTLWAYEFRAELFDASATKSETCSRFYWTLVLPWAMVPEFGWVLVKDWSIILERFAFPLTNIAGKWTRIEDVFSSGDNPASYVSLPGGS